MGRAEGREDESEHRHRLAEAGIVGEDAAAHRAKLPPRGRLGRVHYPQRAQLVRVEPAPVQRAEVGPEEAEVLEPRVRGERVADGAAEPRERRDLRAAQHVRLEAV